MSVSRVLCGAALAVVLWAALVSATHNCVAAGRGCLNGGMCLSPGTPGTGNNGWNAADTVVKCVCSAPYAGFDCSYQVRECKDNPCQNGATCAPDDCMVADASSYQFLRYDCFTCNCPAGYTGSAAYKFTARPSGVCDTRTACDPNPCKNGGDCRETPSATAGGAPTATCDCPAYYYGADCGQRFNCSAPEFSCQNGGVCTSNGFFLTCQCPQYYTGERCEVAPYCTNNACQNGATCQNTGPSAGTGQRSSVNPTTGTCLLPDFCTTHTCQYGGSCANTGSPGSGVGECTCVAPHDGQLSCNATLFCASNPCQNGGTCQNIASPQGGAGQCTCPKGYVGALCEEQLVGCGRDGVGCAPRGQCQCTDQASCANPSGQWYRTACQCDPPTPGGLIPFDCRCNSTSQSRCPGGSVGPGTFGVNEDLVCENGGTCAEWGDGAYCTCRTGFWGERCQNYDNPCLNYPCENGGRCEVVSETGAPMLTDRYWGYFCHCKWPYYGEFCDKIAPARADACAGADCRNGATCVPRDYDYSGNFIQQIGAYLPFAPAYQCNCAAGFTGIYCETAIATCAPTNPCLNGGHCKQNPVGVTCTCPCGYAGARCEFAAANIDAASVAQFANSLGGVGYRLDFCAQSPCQNDGTCHQSLDGQGFVCHCRAGYGGLYCEALVRSAALPATAGSVVTALLAAAAAVIAARRI